MSFTCKLIYKPWIHLNITTLDGEILKLRPLVNSDYEEVFAVVSDAKVWGTLFTEKTHIKCDGMVDMKHNITTVEESNKRTP